MNTMIHTPACEQHEFDLAMLADDMLPPERERMLRAHLATCGGCRLWFEQCASVGERLAAAFAPVKAPAGFEAAVQRRLHAERMPQRPSTTAEEVEREHQRQLELLRSDTRGRVLRTVATGAGILGLTLLLVKLAGPQLLAAQYSIGGASPLALQALLAAAIAAAAFVQTLRVQP